MLVASLLEDIDKIIKNNREEVISSINVLRKKQTADIPLTETLYLDEKRDTTLKFDKIVSKSYKRKVNEVDISIVKEQVSLYAAHFIPQTGSERIFLLYY